MMLLGCLIKSNINILIMIEVTGPPSCYILAFINSLSWSNIYHVFIILLPSLLWTFNIIYILSTLSNEPTSQ